MNPGSRLIKLIEPLQYYEEKLLGQHERDVKGLSAFPRFHRMQLDEKQAAFYRKLTATMASVYPYSESDKLPARIKNWRRLLLNTMVLHKSAPALCANLLDQLWQGYIVLSRAMSERYKISVMYASGIPVYVASYQHKQMKSATLLEGLRRHRARLVKQLRILVEREEATDHIANILSTILVDLEPVRAYALNEGIRVP